MNKENTKRSLQFRDLIYNDYTGIKNVHKNTVDSIKGYKWSYQYFKDKKRYTIESKSLKTLKYKVFKRDLPWIVEDEGRAIQCFLDDMKANRKVPNFTGIWRVRRIENVNSTYYGCWIYHYMENSENIRIFGENLKELKSKVKAHDFPWLILDKKIAKKTYAEDKNYRSFFNSGINRVRKIVDESQHLGFTWAYYYWENDERKLFRDYNLIVLERKAKRKKLPWVTFDENLVKKAYVENEEFLKKHHQKTNSGIYLVYKHTSPQTFKGFDWVYRRSAGEKYKPITSVSLHDLEAKIKAMNLPWIILDDELAKKSYREEIKLNRENPNFTGLLRVTRVKRHLNKYYGCWQYCFKENNIETKIYDEDLFSLKSKVRKKGLSWKILDSKTARKTMQDNYSNIFNSGIENVTKISGESPNSINSWAYYYWEKNERKMIVRTYLNKLEEDVKGKGLPWTVFDEKMAKESYRENEESLKNN